MQCLRSEVDKISDGRAGKITVFKEDLEHLEEEKKEDREDEVSGSYDPELLKEQLQLFDKEEEMANFIETEKILAENCI
jgi:hypothetical protein